MYHAVIGIQLDSNKYSSAIPILRDAVKKYPEDIEVSKSCLFTGLNKTQNAVAAV